MEGGRYALCLADMKRRKRKRLNKSPGVQRKVVGRRRRRRNKRRRRIRKRRKGRKEAGEKK